MNTAGDVNNDGYDDIIIGAPGAASKKGETYVLFGGDFTGDSTVSSASADDALSVSSSGLVSEAFEPRDNPLTPGDTTEQIFVSSTKEQLCLGRVVEDPSHLGNASDLIYAGKAGDIDSDDEEKAL